MPTDDGSSYEAVNAGVYLDVEYCQQPENHNLWWFCRKADCNDCKAARESTTVHPDCLCVYLQDTNILVERDYRSVKILQEGHGRRPVLQALEQLWTVATWRYPWRQADSLALVQPDHHRFRASVVERLAKWFPKVQELPPELVLMILNRLKGHETFRYLSVLHLLEEMGMDDGGSGPIFIPLNTVISWRRGCVARTSHTRTTTGRLIVTIDSWGIHSIDRSPTMTSAPHHVYAIDEGQDISLANLTINVRHGI